MSSITNQTHITLQEIENFYFSSLDDQIDMRKFITRVASPHCTKLERVIAALKVHFTEMFSLQIHPSTTSLQATSKKYIQLIEEIGGKEKIGYRVEPLKEIFAECFNLLILSKAGS